MTDEFTVIETRTRTEWNGWKVDEDRVDWKSENVAITDTGVRFALEPAPTFVAPESIWGIHDIGALDIDADYCGTRYALGSDGALYSAESPTSSFEQVPCDSLATRGAIPTAFCVTADTVYVVGTRPHDSTEPDGRKNGYVQALSASLRQTRWVLEMVRGVPLCAPTRVVRGASHDGCYVLDRGPKDGEGFVARVNTTGTAAVVADGLQRPRDITADDQGGFTVLDVDPDTTDEERLVLKSYPSPTEIDDRRREISGMRLDSDDEGRIECLPVQNARCIEALERHEFVVGVASTPEVEPLLYRYSFGDSSAQPLTSFKRGCRSLHCESGGDGGSRLYAIDDGEQDVFVLEPSERYTPGSSGYTGWLTTWFDLGEIRAEWYRINLTLGDLPPGTRVLLSYATTDRDLSPGGPLGEKEEFEPAEPEYDDCRDIGDDGDDEDDSGPVRWTPVDESNPSDVLIRAEGRRFLWLRLELVGSQYSSPTVEALKLSVTHESYLEYLPTIYLEDKSSATFLTKFLAIFEDTFGDIDHGIETLTEYLGPRSIPGQHLSWLGSWLATAEDEAWADTSKRTLIAEAPVLFKRRGTRRGLERLLEIYLEGIELSPSPWISVSESDENDDEETGAADLVIIVEYGDVVSVAAPDVCDEETRSTADADETLPAPFSDLLCCPQEFLVVLAPTVGEEARATVERIVDRERPVHTVSRTVSISPWGRLGGHTYLGVNSYLPPQTFVVDESSLGLNTVVGSREPGSQLGFGWESRLGDGLELS